MPHAAVRGALCAILLAATRALAAVGLPGYDTRLPSELAGGQQQRGGGVRPR